MKLTVLGRLIKRTVTESNKEVAKVKSFAFYGRVSSDDAQDPSLSIPRQLVACERAVATFGGEIVCCYWDVESGRKALEDRGQGSSAWRERVAVPCKGGLPELLAAAYHGEPFYAVIVESIDRLSRMTADCDANRA